MNIIFVEKKLQTNYLNCKRNWSILRQNKLSDKEVTTKEYILSCVCMYERKALILRQKSICVIVHLKHYTNGGGVYQKD